MKLLPLAIKISFKIFRGFEVVLLIACLYFGLASLYFKYTFDLKRVDDILIYSLFWWTEGTIWASSFSEENFEAVKIGMKEEEVLKLLGQPLQIMPGCSKDEERGLVEFWYAIQGPVCCKNIYPENHQRRTITFSRNGIVLEKKAEINFD